MSERITEIGLVELETGLNKYLHEDGEREPPRMSAKLALQIVAEVRRLRGLIAEADDALQNAHDRLQRLDGRGGDRLHSLDHGRGENDDACEICAAAVRAEARAIREEQGHD